MILVNLLQDLSLGLLGSVRLIDVRHDRGQRPAYEGERDHADDHDHRTKQLFVWADPMDVTVAHGRDGGNRPIEACGIQLG